MRLFGQNVNLLLRFVNYMTELIEPSAEGNIPSNNGASEIEEEHISIENNMLKQIASTCVSNPSQESISDKATEQCQQILKDQILQDNPDRSNLMRPSQSQLVEGARRVSTDSTGSEKLRYIKTQHNQRGSAKNKSEGDGMTQVKSDGFGSLALESCARSQAKQNDNVFQEDTSPKPSIFANAPEDGRQEKIKKISGNDYPDKKISSKQTSLRSAMILPSPSISEWFHRPEIQAYEITFNLAQPTNLAKIIQVLNLFVRDNQLQKVQSSNESIFTMRKKRKKGLLETFCLVLRQCLVLQIRLDLKRDFLTVVLVEGGVQEGKQYTQALKATLWINGLIRLQQSQCISAFLLSQAQEFDAIKKLVRKSQMYCEMDLHKNLKVILNHRKNIVNALDEHLNEIGRFADVALYDIDKTIFTQSKIFKQYCRVNSTNQSLYQIKRQKILSKWTTQQCFKYLEVDPTFQLQEQVDTIPYKQAIDEFQRINQFLTPNQKLRCIIRGYNLIQQCCLSYYDGQVSIDTMDSLLPVLIYVILHSNIQNAYANIKLVEHFVEVTIDSTGQQARIITNVFMSMEYISTSWVP